MKQTIEANRVLESKHDEVFGKLLHNSKLYIFEQLKAAKTDEEYNEAYLARETLETYVIQWERLRAYRMITVDRYLFDSQGILDLEWKKFSEWYGSLKNVDNGANAMPDMQQ